MTFSFHHPTDDPTQPLRARALRYMLLDELRQRPQMTVAEMATTLAEYGFTLTRGVYRYRPTPWTTMRCVTLFAQRARTWVQAPTAGRTPPPTPPDPRARWTTKPLPPTRPPWASLGWLWMT